MKTRILFLWVISLVFGASLYAQDCTMYFPQEVGSVREMTSYDKKDKVSGKVVQKIIDKDVSGKDVTLSVETIIYDEDNNEFSRSEANIGCIDGNFKISMEDYLGEMLEAYESMDIQMQGDNLIVPANLSKGDELPDGTMNIQVQSSGITIVNMDVSIKNRKVLDREEITTDAGTFDCYKISYDTESKTRMITVNTSGVEWLAPGIGVVKTESYNKKGKLTGYSELTSLE